MKDTGSGSGELVEHDHGHDELNDNYISKNVMKNVESKKC